MSAWTKRLRELGARLVLLAFGLLLGGLMAEAVVRLAAPQQLTLLRPDVWVPHDVLGWRRQANLDTQVNTGERTVPLRTDERGRRIGSRPPDTPEIRILVLGDSFVEALQVSYEDSVAGRVESGLEERLGRPVRVDNTAVGGFDPNHYLILTRRALADSSDADGYDAVLVFLYVGNDVVFERKDRFPAKQPETRHPFRLPRDLSAKELIDTTLYPINDVLETRSHLFVLLRSRLKGVKSRLVAIRHADKKKTRDPSSLLEDKSYNPDLADSPRWSLTAEVCADLDALAREHGVPVLFVLLPGKIWIHPEALELELRGMGLPSASVDLEQPFRRLREELQARDLDVLSTLEDFRRARRQGEEHLFGRVDTHMSPAGHRLLAELVLERLELKPEDGLDPD